MPQNANRRRARTPALDTASPEDLPIPARQEPPLSTLELALQLRQCELGTCSLQLPENLSEADWEGIGNTLL